MLFKWSSVRAVLFMGTCLVIYRLLSSDKEVQTDQKHREEWRDRHIGRPATFAYVNLCTNMRAVFPSLVLFEQLRSYNASSNADFVVLLPELLYGQVGAMFHSFGIRTKIYSDASPLFQPSYSVSSMTTMKRDLMLWQKLRVWNMTEYKKIVMLDNDLLLTGKIDELFNEPELSGVPQLYSNEKIMFWDPRDLENFVPIVDDPSFISNEGLNGGVVVLNPSSNTFNQLVLQASQLGNRTCCPTQEFLFRHFRKQNAYHRLPSKFNVRKIQKITNRHFIEKDMRVYHFVEKRKPLLLGRAASQNDPMSRAWWVVADAVDDLLDDYVLAYPDQFSLVIRMREAAISPQLGTQQRQ